MKFSAQVQFMLLLSNTQVPPFSQGQAVGKELYIFNI